MHGDIKIFHVHYWCWLCLWASWLPQHMWLRTGWVQPPRQIQLLSATQLLVCCQGPITFQKVSESVRLHWNSLLGHEKGTMGSVKDAWEATRCIICRGRMQSWRNAPKTKKNVTNPVWFWTLTSWVVFWVFGVYISVDTFRLGAQNMMLRMWMVFLCLWDLM